VATTRSPSPDLYNTRNGKSFFANTLKISRSAISVQPPSRWDPQGFATPHFLRPSLEATPSAHSGPGPWSLNSATGRRIVPSIPGTRFRQATGVPRAQWENPSPPTNYASDILNFAAFAPLGAPPAPVPDTSSIAKGRNVFTNVGCGACHIQQHTTGQSTYPNQSNVTYFPYSDFQPHDMGDGPADGISQGNASVVSSARLHYGVLENRYFFCTTVAPKTCCRLSRHTVAKPVR
jgi:hypothetical protein